MTKSNIGGGIFMETKKATSFEVKVGVGRKFAFSLGELAQNLSNGLVAVFFMMFCTEVAGIHAGVVGTLLLLGRVWDMINDTLVGSWTDRTRSKLGRYRPWLLWFNVPLFVSTILMFWAHPEWSVMAKTIWIVVLYFIWCFMYTCVNIPHTAMVAVMSASGAERASISGWKMMFTNIGTIFGGAATMPIVMRLGGENAAKGWLNTVTLYSIVGIVLVFICVAVCKEVVKPKDDQGKMPILKGVALALKNKYFVLLVIGAAILGMLNLGRATSQTYLFMYVIGDMNAMSVYAIVTGIGGMIGAFTLPFFANLLKSKGKVICYGSFLGAVFLLIQYFCSNSLNVGFWISGFLSYICFWLALAGTVAATGDTADYALLSTGVRQEGLYGAYWSFMHKAGIAIGSAEVGWMLAATNYVANAPEQPAEVINGIKMIYFILPIILSVVVGIVFLFYKLDYKKHEEILEEQKAKGLMQKD
jgi:sugar (Glycoside-Pentoside-Hexuronide) transporter